MQDVAAWDRAARLQQPALDDVIRTASTLAQGTTIFAFGDPAQVSDGIPIFYVSWDLVGALQIKSGNDDLRAYPVHEKARLSCGSTSVAVRYPEFDGTASAPYGAAVFHDVLTDETSPIRSRAACKKARREFRSGAWHAPSDFDGTT